MAQVQRITETDIKKLLEMARAEVKEDKVIPWIIERSEYWRSQGYTEIKKAIQGLDVTD